MSSRLIYIFPWDCYQYEVLGDREAKLSIYEKDLSQSGGAQGMPTYRRDDR